MNFQKRCGEQTNPCHEIHKYINNKAKDYKQLNYGAYLCKYSSEPNAKLEPTKLGKERFCLTKVLYYGSSGDS